MIWLKICHFVSLGGPWGLSIHPKRSGAKPPTFLDGSKAPRDRPEPQNDRFSPLPLSYRPLKGPAAPPVSFTSDARQFGRDCSKAAKPSCSAF